MAARIEREPTVVISRDTLFTGRYFAFTSDLHPDGDRLVVPEPAASTTTPEAGASEPERTLVVVNWFTELLERTGN